MIRLRSPRGGCSSKNDRSNDAAPLTPGLPPHELQAACGGKVFLDGVVHPLDEHAGQVGLLEQVRHGGAVTEGVYRPAAARDHTWNSRRTARLKMNLLNKVIFSVMFHSATYRQSCVM